MASASRETALSIAVVGAGIVGAACACALSRRGHRVTVFDPDDPGSGASYGNAGLISTGGVVPIAMPGIWRRVPRMLLDPDSPLSIRWRYLPRIAPFLLRMLLASRASRVEEISRGMAELLQGAYDAYVDLLGEETAKTLIRRDGLLHTFSTEAAFAAAAPGIGLRRRRGVAFDVLDGAALRQLVPALHPGVARGLFYPGAAHAVDPQGLVRALMAEAAVRGGSLVRARVEALVALADGRLLVRLAAGDDAFDRVVIAAGARSRKLARDVGARVPLDAERGYHVMLPRPGIDVRVPMMAIDRSIAVTPMREGLRITGMVEFAGVDAPADWSKADRVLRQARALLPDLATAGATRWMGSRPSLPDTLPIIARAPAAPHAILAFGHGHLGMSLAATTARRVAALVGEGAGNAAGRPRPTA